MYTIYTRKWLKLTKSSFYDNVDSGEQVEYEEGYNDEHCHYAHVTLPEIKHFTNLFVCLSWSTGWMNFTLEYKVIGSLHCRRLYIFVSLRISSANF